MTIPAVVLAAAADRRLPPRSLGVYVFLFTQLDTVAYRPIKQSWLARRVGLCRQNVNVALARLEEFGYLEQPRRNGRQDGFNTYRLTVSPPPPAEAQKRAARVATHASP